jgi:hypothetical protein
VVEDVLLRRIHQAELLPPTRSTPKRRCLPTLLVVIGIEPGGNEIRHNSGQIMRQPAGGPIKICSGRIVGKVFITVVGYQVGGGNSKADSHMPAAHALAEFDLTGEIDQRIVQPRLGGRHPGSTNALAQGLSAANVYR